MLISMTEEAANSHVVVELLCWALLEANLGTRGPCWGTRSSATWTI